MVLTESTGMSAIFVNISIKVSTGTLPISQSTPVKPVSHRHTYVSSEPLTKQVPLLRHGFGMQGVVGAITTKRQNGNIENV